MVVIFFIVLIVGFVDDNSFMHRFDRRSRMSQLRSEIETYKAQYEAADLCLREMDANPKSIEKMAREKYFMKRPGEDVFVIRESENNEDSETDAEGSVKE